MPTHRQKIKRALLSVSDKTALVEFARFLQSIGVELLSTAGTARLLQDANIEVVEIADYTGFPEMMDGRVKTLHPKVHGALLARPQDAAVMKAHGIEPIDLLVVNLYPFVEVSQRAGTTVTDAIEQIDIGGPAMIRAAAKNYHNTVVVVNPSDYRELQVLLEQNQGELAEGVRLQLASKAFAHTARYDSAISYYFAKQRGEFPDSWAGLTKGTELRYGENPHQSAVLYINNGLAAAEPLQGKPLSFNNYLDLDAAVAAIKDFPDDCACVIVKHTNPCGVACAPTPTQAYQRAYQTDPLSAFGGIIAFNCPLQRDTAEHIIGQQFVELIVAPEVSTAAQAVLSAKPQLRLMRYQTTAVGDVDYSCRSISGGLVLQQPDHLFSNSSAAKVVTKRSPSDAEMRDLMFAERVVKHAKSNAVVYAKDRHTIGVGSGQTSRIDAMKIAALKAARAELKTNGAVLASDAFFPFADSIEYAAELGIGAVLQPGGSIKDGEVIAAADANNMAMVFTGIRHFRH